MSLERIKGNSLVIDLLKEDIKKNKISCSYLFVGPEGIGKRMIALFYAKLLNCEAPASNLEPCQRCISCMKIDKGEHPDVYLIETKESLSFVSENKEEDKERSDFIRIEKIREIQHKASLLPYESKYKIFIIDNAHNLTEEASNAFLKTLEEPSQDTIFILISKALQFMPRTIISRCRILRFSPLPLNILKDILINEYGLNSSEAHFLTYFSEGRIGYALRLKDHPIIKQRNEVIKSFINREKVFISLELENKENLRLSLELLIHWFKDLYLLKLEPKTEHLTYLEQRKELLKMAHYFLPLNIEGIITQLSLGLDYLRNNINPKILLANIKPWIWQDLYF